MEMLGFWHVPILCPLLVIRQAWLECADVYALQLVIYVDPTCGAVCASCGLGGRWVGPSHSATHATMAVDNLEGFLATCHCEQGTWHEPGMCWETPPPRVVTCGPPGGGLEHKHGEVDKHEERHWVAAKP